MKVTAPPLAYGAFYRIQYSGILSTVDGTPQLYWRGTQEESM